MLLRFFSYLFSLLLGLFLAGVSFVLLIGGTSNYKFDMVPWIKGENALYFLLVFGLLGVISALLAVLGKVKPLLVVFTLVTVCLFIYGFFISPVFRFDGEAQAKNVAWLAFAAVGAFLGSLMQYSSSTKRG
ncbi:MAG: hypothetical protein HY821_15715 [Acidobacteria bacterium]|nr:hypothetical protein [Acidobacteriota bacterium]